MLTQDVDRLKNVLMGCVALLLIGCSYQVKLNNTAPSERNSARDNSEANSTNKSTPNSQSSEKNFGSSDAKTEKEDEFASQPVIISGAFLTHTCSHTEMKKDQTIEFSCRLELKETGEVDSVPQKLGTKNNMGVSFAWKFIDHFDKKNEVSMSEMEDSSKWNMKGQVKNKEVFDLLMTHLYVVITQGNKIIKLKPLWYEAIASTTISIPELENQTTSNLGTETPEQIAKQIQDPAVEEKSTIETISTDPSVVGNPGMVESPLVLDDPIQKPTDTAAQNSNTPMNTFFANSPKVNIHEEQDDQAVVDTIKLTGLNYPAIISSARGRDGNGNIILKSSLSESQDREQTFPEKHSWTLVKSDLNHDGIEDIIYAGRHLGWLKGDGTGFADINIPEDSNGVFSSPTRGAGAMDVDKDGLVDLVACSENSMFWLRNIGNVVSEPLFYGNTAAVFDDDRGCRYLKIIDIDFDGVPEALVSDDKKGEIRSYSFINGQSGVEVSSTTIASNLGYIKEVRVLPSKKADSLTLIATSETSGVYLLTKNKGVIAFNSERISQIPAHSSDFGDVDLDGDIDIVFASHDHERIYGLQKNGQEFIQTMLASVAHPVGIRLSDQDGDGDLDILVSSFSDKNGNLRSGKVIYIKNDAKN